MDSELIAGVSYLKSSKYRTSIVILLHDNIMTPAEIQQKLDIRLNHVSLYLRELKEKGIIVCLNEDAKKGRLYQLSELGYEIYQHVK